MSKVALLINLVAICVYGFSAYTMNSISFGKGFKEIIPPQLQVYGQLKFLTYQCLLIQILSTALHILAHFSRPLRKWRDLVFTTLALPVGCIVVITFWAVWLTLGRELILPAKMDAFFPAWLNHSTHTVILPINLLLAILIHHRYTNNGVLVTLAYSGAYTVFLHVIKAQTGLFVYGYLNEFSELQRMIYFAATGIFTYSMYKFGQLLTNSVHSQFDQSKKDKKVVASPKKQKQK